MGHSENGACSDICAQIDRVAGELTQLSVQQLAVRIDDIRRCARGYGMLPVEALAHRLEGVLSGKASRATVIPFLDTMREAASCERSDPAAVQSYLAVISQRRYR